MSFNLNELDKLEAAATKGWTLEPVRPGDKWLDIPEARISVDYDDVDHDQQLAHAQLTVALRNAYHAMAARLRTLEAEVKAARELLTPNGYSAGTPKRLYARGDYAKARKATDATGGVT